MKTSLVAGALALLLVATAALHAEEGDGEAAVLLDPITITEPVQPLDAPLWRLKLLLDATTPCLGCDANVAPTRENLLTGLVRFLLLPAEPPPRDEARRALSAVRCASAGPESEFRCP